MTVCGLVRSSKRMVYPTSSPNLHPCSFATRLATALAATLLNWVQPIRPAELIPSSLKYCVIWVVLPEPV